MVSVDVKHHVYLLQPLAVMATAEAVAPSRWDEDFVCHVLNGRCFSSVSLSALALFLSGLGSFCRKSDKLKPQVHLYAL